MEFINGERYHIFNRGVEKIDIFKDSYDYQRFLLGMKEFNALRPIGSFRDKLQIDKIKSDRVSSPVTSNPCKQELASTGFEALSSDRSMVLVRIIAYCLNPNHYHLILEQVEDGGISKFIKKLGGGYTTYFNRRHSRSGALFQGKFKSVHIEINEYLLYLSAYVNTNNFIHGYRNDKNWIYSSWLDYIGKRNGDLCDKSIVLDQFQGNVEDYKKFIEINAEHLKSKKMLEKYLLE